MDYSPLSICTKQKKKQLLLSSLTSDIADYLCDTILSVIYDEVEVKVYYWDEHDPDTIEALKNTYEPDLILATGNHSKGLIQEHFPDVPVELLCLDLIEPKCIEQLFSLPRGKKVLLVNKSRASAISMIDTLLASGLDHIGYLPYWENCGLDYGNIDTAVSPGMLAYTPADIPIKIDIGLRNLSITSFLNILNKLDLPLYYLDKFVSRQKKVLINSFKELSKELSVCSYLEDSLQTITNGLDEAIITIDSKHCVTELNVAAARLLQTTRKETIGKKLSEIFLKITDIDMERYLTEDSSPAANKNLFLYDRQFTVNFNPVSGDTINHGIIRIKEIEIGQNNTSQIKKIPYQKNRGYFARYTFDDIISLDKNMENLLLQAKFLARTDYSILILGESGTGKELFAQSIHNYSPRTNQPFVAVNFAALPESLVESELFGYEEGAFTGARKQGKKGLFELADNGTIFLDEIGDASLMVQSRLLRVLEEKEIMRVGDVKITPVNIRIIAATNKNLEELMAQHKFREDLYYRLNVFLLKIPPLRKRKEILMQLSNVLSHKLNINKTFSDEALKCIQDYDWPGNMREFKNMLEYSALISKSAVIQADELPLSIQKVTQARIEDKTNVMEAYCILSKFFDIRQLESLLNVYANNKESRYMLGRKTVLSLLEYKGVYLSDSKLRTLTKHLSDCGMLQVGKTKQGTVITNKGLDFLMQLQQIEYK